jgi:cytochrome c oxidase cbb3-type subunit 1
MYSVKLIDTHFWMHTIGVVVYIVAMWIAGVMQGLMWRATDPDNGTLVYSFVEALNATKPYYLFRLGGGLIVLSGMFVMAWNVFKTYQLAASAVTAQPVLPPDVADARA